MPVVKAIHHYAIVVSNLAESIQWYYDHLDFHLERESAWPERGLKVVHIVTDSGVRIEIFEQSGSQPSADVGRDAFEALMIQGSKHIGMQIENLEAFAAALTQKGVTIVHPIMPVAFAPLRNF